MNGDFADSNILEKIFIPIAVLMPMILWYISFRTYQKYYVAKLNANEKVGNDIFGDEGGGQMSADGFTMRPPLPIEDNSTDLDVQIFTKEYNKIVKIFWLTTIIGWTIIIVGLNLIRHYNLLK